MSDSATPWTVAHQVPLCMEFSRQEDWLGCHFLLQGIFLCQGWNLHLLYWQAGSLPLSHPGLRTCASNSQVHIRFTTLEARVLQVQNFQARGFIGSVVTRPFLSGKPQCEPKREMQKLFSLVCNRTWGKPCTSISQREQQQCLAKRTWVNLSTLKGRGAGQRRRQK